MEANERQLANTNDRIMMARKGEIKVFRPNRLNVVAAQRSRWELYAPKCGEQLFSELRYR